MPKVPVPPRDYKEWLYDLLRSGITGLSPEQHVDEIVFGIDAAGKLREMEFRDSGKKLYSLIISTASAVSTSWSMKRS